MFGGRASASLSGLLAGLLLVACGATHPSATAGTSSASVSRAKELIIAEPVTNTTLDPQREVALPNLAALHEIFDGLVDVSPDGHVTPELATSWEGANDGVTWTFHLRQNVKFQDGTPFTADVVKATIERVISPGSLAGTIKTLWRPIKDVSVVDPYSVKIVTSGPFGPFLAHLGNWGNAGMMDPAAIQKYGSDIVSHPVGTGPYRLVSWSRGSQLVLERNPDYWGPKPYFDRIIYQQVPEGTTRLAMLENGEADVITGLTPQVTSQLSGKSGLGLVRVQSIEDDMMMINTRRPPTNSPLVRQAINYGIDRQALITNVLQGEAKAVTSILPPTVAFHKSEPSYPYDPARAKALLAQAGVKPGTPLVIASSQGRWILDSDVTQAVAAQLGQLGFQTKIQVMGDYGQYVASRNSGDYNLSFLGWATTPDVLFPLVFGSANVGKEWNWSNLADSRLDAAVNKALTSVKESDQQAAYAEAQDVVYQDVPVALLYTPEFIIGVRSDVQGVALRADGTLDLANAHRTAGNGS